MTFDRQDSLENVLDHLAEQVSEALDASEKSGTVLAALAPYDAVRALADGYRDAIRDYLMKVASETTRVMDGVKMLRVEEVREIVSDKFQRIRSEIVQTAESRLRAYSMRRGFSETPNFDLTKGVDAAETEANLAVNRLRRSLWDRIEIPVRVIAGVITVSGVLFGAGYGVLSWLTKNSNNPGTTEVSATPKSSIALSTAIPTPSNVPSTGRPPQELSPKHEQVQASSTPGSPIQNAVKAKPTEPVTTAEMKRRWQSILDLAKEGAFHDRWDDYVGPTYASRQVLVWLRRRNLEEIFRRVTDFENASFESSSGVNTDTRNRVQALRDKLNDAIQGFLGFDEMQKHFLAEGHLSSDGVSTLQKMEDDRISMIEYFLGVASGLGLAPQEISHSPKGTASDLNKAQPSSSPTPAPVLSQTTPLVTTSAPALTPLPTTLPSTATPTPVASTAESLTPSPTFETQKMVLPDKDQRRLKEILVSFLGYTPTEISLDLLKQREVASLLVHQADLCSQRWLDENSGDHGIEKILSQNYRAKDLWDQIFSAISGYRMNIQVANTEIDDPTASPGVIALALKNGESARKSIDRCVRNLAGYVGISL
jgi:hypothetical protein